MFAERPHPLDGGLVEIRDHDDHETAAGCPSPSHQERDELNLADTTRARSLTDGDLAQSVLGDQPTNPTREF